MPGPYQGTGKRLSPCSTDAGDRQRCDGESVLTGSRAPETDIGELAPCSRAAGGSSNPNAAEQRRAVHAADLRSAMWAESAVGGAVSASEP